MLHAGIRFSGSRVEGNPTVCRKSIMGEAIPWNGKYSKERSGWLSLQRFGNLSVLHPGEHRRGCGRHLPDTVLLLRLSKMQHGVGGHNNQNSTLANLHLSKSGSAQARAAQGSPCWREPPPPMGGEAKEE